MKCLQGFKGSWGQVKLKQKPCDPKSPCRKCYKPPGRCANLAPGARGALCTAQCLPRGKADQSPLNCVGRILAGLRSGKPPKANQTNERSLQRPTSGRNPAHTDLYGLGRPKPPKWPCEPTLYYRVVVAQVSAKSKWSFLDWGSL